VKGGDEKKKVPKASFLLTRLPDTFPIGYNFPFPNLLGRGNARNRRVKFSCPADSADCAPPRRRRRREESEDEEFACLHRIWLDRKGY